MESLLYIDESLSILLNNLKSESSKLSFMDICEFKILQSKEKIPFDNLNYKGIYMIEIKNCETFDSFEDWILNFRQIWLGENNCFEKKSTPSIKKKRIKYHYTLESWIPLYIGKSKNIKNRIYEHIFKELEKSTFALKLAARENLKNEIFRLKTIRVEVENYDLILPILENELRNKFNPIIGRQ